MIENLTPDMITSLALSFFFNLIVQVVYYYYSAEAFEHIIAARLIKLAPSLRYLMVIFDAGVITTICWYCKKFLSIQLEDMLIAACILCVGMAVRNILDKKFHFKQYLRDCICNIICIGGSYYIFLNVS